MRYAVVLFSAALICLPSMAQIDLCPDIAKAISYAKTDFADIKGAQMPDEPVMYKSSFTISSVDDSCLIIPDEDKPKKLSLVCSHSFSTRRMSKEEASEQSDAYYNSLAEKCKGCMEGRSMSHRSNKYGESLEVTELGTSGYGFEIEASISQRCSTTRCGVYLDINLE
jgi:hypothetical protein